MELSEYAFRWDADAGVKWQPKLLDGSREWGRRDDWGVDSHYVTAWMKEESGPYRWEPILYKSQRRAERVARREQKRRDRVAANEYREAEEEHDDKT